MPTSSQSKILSTVDYQFLHQQQHQTSSQDGIPVKPVNRISVNQSPLLETRRRLSKDERRPSIGKKDNGEKLSPPPSNLSFHRRSSIKLTDGARTSQRNDAFHMPIITLNNPSRTSLDSALYRRDSLNDDNQYETEYKLKEFRTHPTPIHPNASLSDLENFNDEEEENENFEPRSSFLNDNARRLLFLGTIRPSKTFYKDLPDSDVQYLMEYFHRMRNTNRNITSEEINQELKTKFTQYKPKIFYDSTCVTKRQVNNIEKFIEPYAEKIRNHQAELIQLDDPFRFVIKSIDNDTSLITIPREYNDCLLTLLTRTDPLRKSQFIMELISTKLVEDVKANSLDISYFPGGINYDVPHDDINENGQMKIETYEKLKKRLNTRKLWYFNGPPEKKPNALLAIIPTNISTTIHHQHLFDALYERLKNLSSNENFHPEKSILSIEFLPLSCILDSYDISNQFIIDCDTNEIKQILIDKPLKINLNKQIITIDLQSYDENIHREYQKFVKAEKYRELIKNHDEAIKQTRTTK